MKKWASLVAQTAKNLPAMWETRVPSLNWENPLEKKMATPLVFLPGESHGQRMRWSDGVTDLMDMSLSKLR